MQSAIHRFSAQDAMSFFEGLGVPLKTERGRRVFPISDKAGDIVGALTRLCHKNGVEILRDRAKAIKIGPDGVDAVVTERREIPCRNAVICTGGLSYPGTGSTGDGYRMAKELGHTVTKCRPSLVPLESPDVYCREMQGFSLRNVALLRTRTTNSYIKNSERCFSPILAYPGRWCYRLQHTCVISVKPSTA